MKNVFYVLISLFVLFVSCNSNEDPGQATETDSVPSKTLTEPGLQITGCYSMIQQRDTAVLNLLISDNKVAGRLHYKRFEKDDNEGLIDGVLRDSLIIANYTFKSEGITSVREVIFSIKNDSLFEAYGEVIVTGDTAKFANASRLNFLPAPFVKFDCAGQ